ncbi:hypothetical protein, partial [Affinibrenneria salicis]|uniref:hypothetical protein n=1 Tax=Affinibrenneria salicis TaxID=2590031 RepID=UPI001CC66B9A
FRLQASGFRLQASGFRLQASGFRLQASGFRLQASGFRLQASGFSCVDRARLFCSFQRFSPAGPPSAAFNSARDQLIAGLPRYKAYKRASSVKLHCAALLKTITFYPATRVIKNILFNNT